MSSEGLADALEGLALVDHHVHGATAEDLDRAAFEQLVSESDRPPARGTTRFDSQVGLAMLRWCAPLLDLPPHPDPDAYLARRRELGAEEVTRRLLRASGVGRYLVETGYASAPTLSPEGMAAAAGVPADEVVRLERVAEELALEGGATAGGFAAAFAGALERRTSRAVGLKTIIAYRLGLDFDPEPPAPGEVAAAAGRWLGEVEATGRARVEDPVLLRHVVWAGVERGLPLQVHSGLGDPDVRLARTDPALLTRFLELVEPHGVDVLLLHCYPFQRQAGFLAHSYPHVYLDVGLAVNYAGLRADAVIAESLELAPFGKVLFSSDAWGPAELHFLGALLFRRGMAHALGAWVEEGAIRGADAVRIAGMVGAGNARRVYRLGDER